MTRQFVPRSLITSGIRALPPIGLVAIVILASASGCAHQPWPDEPGVPVELVRSDNLAAEDLFLGMLTSRRREANLTPPIIAAPYQDQLRGLAADLQAGKASIPAAEEALVRWARATHRRAVKPFALDCSQGANMQMPPALVDEPALVISYAAAHFRPRSLPTPQCVVLGTVLAGEAVESTNL